MHAASRVNELQELSLNKQLYAEYHGYQFYFALSEEWERFFPQRGSLLDTTSSDAQRDKDRVPGEFVKVIGIWEAMQLHSDVDWVRRLQVMS
jgi:hypothetical protein